MKVLYSITCLGLPISQINKISRLVKLSNNATFRISTTSKPGKYAFCGWRQGDFVVLGGGNLKNMFGCLISGYPYIIINLNVNSYVMAYLEK